MAIKPLHLLHLLSALILLNANNVHAFPAVSLSPDSVQLPTKERFFKFAPGYAYQQGRDEGMSPLIYSGSHFNGVISIEKHKNNRFNALDLEVMLGRLRPSTQPKPFRSRAAGLRLQMDYQHLRLVRTWNNNQLQLFIGGATNNMLSVLWHRSYMNNSLNYAFSSAIGAAARLQYPFFINGKKFKPYAQIHLPLLAFNLRPSYVSSIPEGYIAQERGNIRAFFDSGKLQTINRFFRVRNELGIQRVLKTGNEVFLAYRWDYYSIPHEHKIQMAVHQILLGWKFSF